MKKSQEKLKTSGAPNFGASEKDILLIKRDLQKLAVSNNNMAAHVDEMRKIDIIQKTLECHYMSQVMLGMLVEKGIITEEEVHERAKQVQLNSGGLVDKSDGVAAQGDTMLMRWILMHEGREVENRMKETLAYEIGSGGLPCDQDLIGMRVGELRVFNCTFGPGFRHKDLVNKETEMHIQCVGLKVKGAANLGVSGGEA